MEEERKHGTIASILLFFLGMIAQAAGAADIQINGEFLTSPHAKLTNTVSGAADVEINGDYTNPAAAMTNYSTWCLSPSAASPCLLKILPGVSDVGKGSVVMQPYIDIEGSGEDTTVITGSIDGGRTSCGPPPANGVVNGANKAEIRRLTVRHTGGGTGAAAIANSDASPKVTNVTVTVSPSSLCSVGIRNRNSSPIIAGARVTATGSGAAVSCVGIYNDTGSLPTIRNAAVTASAGNPNIGIFSGGDSTHPGRVRIYDSVIKATTNTISTPGEVIVMVFNAQMDGGGIIGTGTTHCVGVYDENYVLSPYDACP